MDAKSAEKTLRAQRWKKGYYTEYHGGHTEEYRRKSLFLCILRVTISN
jgi:hypothetical protein